MFESTPQPRSWGFRFFLSDSIVIGVLIIVAIALQHLGHPLWWIIVIVAGHFFLFCNVFRIRRALEYGWAATFLANATLWLGLGNLNWFGVLAIQFPITVGVIAAELRSPRYHGIFARQTNPRLNDYLNGTIP